MVHVSVKWTGRVFEVDVDPEQSAVMFKAQLFSLTSVTPERQKIIGLKGGPLKDGSDLKTGMKLMLVGTPEGAEIKAIKEQVIFTEDLTPEQHAILMKEKQLEPVPSGLSNLGTTCYVNSVVQFLRPVAKFSDLIKSLPASSGSWDPRLRLCDSFRELFKSRELTEESVYPLAAVEHLRNCFPQFATKNKNGSYMQQDAEECLSLLLECFSSQSDIVDSLFRFTLESTVTCEENPEEKEPPREEQVRVLSCHMGSQLAAVDHLHQGVRLALETTLTKMSDSLGRDTKHKKILRISSLPEFMVVHFVRFEWKAASASSRTEAGRTKICRKVNFPTTFDVHEFCSDSLKKELRLGRRIHSGMAERDAEARNAKKQKSSNKEPIAAETVPIEPAVQEQQNPESTQQLSYGYFDLVSIVTHQGRSADSGHYVAWTKKDKDTWYQFNDDKVTEVKWKDLDLYGGRGDYHIATLLMYEQKRVPATATVIAQTEVELAKEDKAKEDKANEKVVIQTESAKPDLLRKDADVAM